MPCQDMWHSYNICNNELEISFPDTSSQATAPPTSASSSPPAAMANEIREGRLCLGKACSTNSRGAPMPTSQWLVFEVAAMEEAEFEVAAKELNMDVGGGVLLCHPTRVQPPSPAPGARRVPGVAGPLHNLGLRACAHRHHDTVDSEFPST